MATQLRKAASAGNDGSLVFDPGMSLAEKFALLRSAVSADKAAAMMERLLLSSCQGDGEGSGSSGLKARVEAELDAVIIGAKEARVEERQWNGEFQSLLEMEDGIEKYALLRGLYNDFCYAADAYGRIIISERYLPEAMKTIRPVHGLGYAGGEKYMVRNLLFKFAVDLQLPDGKWLYGGSKRCDEAAMKVASNELTGLIHCFKCEVPALHLPLMVLIDYRGYRLTALSLLPIDKSTLVYGSDDAGATVHNKLRLFASKMEQISSMLNLMGHNVHGTKINGPADLEGHRGHDGRLYLLDFSRVFPPEAPAPGAADPKAIFHRLLRPELVKRSDIPLSSDAFSKFQKDDPREKALNEQVDVVTRMLFEEIIPQFALSLSESAAAAEFDEGTLVGSIHRAGINVRHMGRLRSHVVDAPQVRRLLLSDMCARCIKVLVRAVMREQMKEYHLPAVEPYTAVVVYVYNLVFGWGFESAMFWRHSSAKIPLPPSISGNVPIRPIKVLLGEKFAQSLDATELAPDMDLRDAVDLPHLAQALHRMLNVTLSVTAQALLQNGVKGTMIELSHDDILGIGTRINALPIIDYYSGIQLSLAASTKQGDEYKRLVVLAEARFRSTLESLPDHAPTYFQWAKLLHSNAVKIKDTTAFSDALRTVHMALDIDPIQSSYRVLACTILVDWARLLLTRSLEEKSKTYLRQAVEKLRDAVKIDSAIVRKSTAELFASTQQRFVRSSSCSYTAEDEMYFEVLHHLLELRAAAAAAGAGSIIMRSSAPSVGVGGGGGDDNVERLLGDLLFQWASALLDAIHFQDDAKDSVRILQVAEKLQAAWPHIARERCRELLDSVETMAGTPLLRMFALGRFFTPLGDRLKTSQHCAQMLSFEFTKFVGLPESLLLDVWEYCPNLEVVLFHCCTQVIGAVPLSTMAAKLKSLCVLSLAGCPRVERAGVAEFARSMGPRLNSLDLSLCLEVGDDEVRAISEHCFNLESISLSKTLVTADSLAALLKACQKLVLLDISGCGNVENKLFVGSAQYCTKLEFLICASCAQLSSKAIAPLHKIPRLAVLDVSHCLKMEEKGLLQLLRCNSLKHVYAKGLIMDAKNIEKMMVSFECHFSRTYAEEMARLDMAVANSSASRSVARGEQSPRKVSEVTYYRCKCCCCCCYCFVCFFPSPPHALPSVDRRIGSLPVATSVPKSLSSAAGVDESSPRKVDSPKRRGSVGIPRKSNANIEVQWEDEVVPPVSPRPAPSVSDVALTGSPEAPSSELRSSGNLRHSLRSRVSPRPGAAASAAPSSSPPTPTIAVAPPNAEDDGPAPRLAKRTTAAGGDAPSSSNTEEPKLARVRSGMFDKLARSLQSRRASQSLVGAGALSPQSSPRPGEEK